MILAFDKIKELADKQGISLNTLEERLGYSTNYLYSLKKGNPKSDRLQEIADYFNLTARNSPTSKVAGCKGFGLVQGLAPCA